MVLNSVTALVSALREHGLLDRKQLDELPRIQPQYADAVRLTEELVRRTWLTSFQARALLHGRGHRLIVGPYLILDRLGEGGMGLVFKARNRRLNRLTALKIIAKDRLNNPEIIRRFYHEVQAAAQLCHPNVVIAFDAGRKGKVHYFAMEYVDGIDLGRLVKENGPLPVLDACDYIRQGALGLQHAYERGLVHRDIKPSNLLLTRKGNVVKLSDLGLALVQAPGVSARASGQTDAGSVLGTPDYIAPEQARHSHAADIRSDLYSLGCTFYQLLTGEVPFPEGSLTEKLLKHEFDVPVPLESLRPDVPAAVQAIVQRLMAKAPANRYQTPAALVAALDEVLQAEQGFWRATPVTVPPHPTSPPSLTNTPSPAVPSTPTSLRTSLVQTKDPLAALVPDESPRRAGTRLRMLLPPVAPAWRWIAVGSGAGAVLLVIALLFLLLLRLMHE